MTALSPINQNSPIDVEEVAPNSRVLLTWPLLRSISWSVFEEHQQRQLSFTRMQSELSPTHILVTSLFMRLSKKHTNESLLMKVMSSWLIKDWIEPTCTSDSTLCLYMFKMLNPSEWAEGNPTLSPRISIKGIWLYISCRLLLPVSTSPSYYNPPSLIVMTLTTPLTSMFTILFPTFIQLETMSLCVSRVQFLSAGLVVETWLLL